MSLTDEDKGWFSRQLDEREKRADARFDALEKRVYARVDALETRMHQEMEALEMRMREHTEAVETRLVAEFWKWARTAEARYRQNQSVLQG